MKILAFGSGQLKSRKPNTALASDKQIKIAAILSDLKKIKAKVKEAKLAIPPQSPSIPSIKLYAFVTPIIQQKVIMYEKKEKFR